MKIPHRSLNTQKKHQGFTLVEISVVLVIIGLIIGGILLGTTLIRSSEIKNVISQFEQYDAAMVAFRSKYDGLPGDLPNATSFFSGATDGNDDGRIFWNNGETLSAWRQLALSELIPGSYTGTGATLTRLNAPMGFGERAVFAIYFVDNINTPGISAQNMWSGNYVEILAPGNALTSFTRGILPSLDAIAIDTKIDDGRPGTGRVLGALGGNVSCLNSAAGYNYSGSYIANTNNRCTISMRLSAQ